MKKAVGLLACSLMMGLFLVSSGRAEKVYKIGILQNVKDLDKAVDGFKDGMKALGYEEGKNIEYEYQIAEAVPANMSKFAEQFIAAKKDLIFACSTPVAKVLKEYTAASTDKIPVVFTPVSDPVVAGLVSSKKSSGNNLTGVASGVVTDKQLEMLLDMVPKIKRVLVISKKGDPSSEAGLNLIISAARRLGVELIVERPIDEANLMTIIKNTNFSKIGAIHIPPDTMVGKHVKTLYEAGKKYRIPIIVHSPLLLKDGGFLSYVSDYYKLGKQVAVQADKILKGAFPSQLQVEDPDRYDLAINLDVAKELGIAVPAKYKSQARFLFSGNVLTDAERK